MAYWFSMMKVFKLDLMHKAKRFQSRQPKTSSKRALQWTTLSKHAPSWLFADYQHVATKAEQPSSLATTEEEVGNYLTDNLKMLENFLLDSNLGQFPMRLHLIRPLALTVQLDRQEYEAEEEKKAKDLLKKLKQHQQAVQSPVTISCFLREVENLLFGMWHSYANCLTNVRQFQDLFQQPLQQKVKDEVKLNKWDDITVIALIENSEKINRKLNNYLKQYQEEVLDYPVRRLIYRENMKDLIDEHGERIPSYEVPSQAILFPVVQSSSSSSNLLLQKVEEFYKLYHWQAIQSQQHKVPKQQSATLSQEMISAFPRLGRLSKLVRKVDKHLETLFSFPDMTGLVEDPSQCEHLCLVGLNFSLLCEEACQNVFDRLQTLRGEKVNMQVKKKALRDFFSFLHEQGGYSHLRSEVPSIACLSNPIELFQSASLLPQLQARSLSSFESLDKDFLSKGEKYLTKSLVELSQLRVQVSSRQHHPDVTTIESLHMVTYCESMLTYALQSRAAIEAGLRNVQSYSSHLLTLSQEIHRLQGSSIANSSRRSLSSIEMQQLVDQNLHTFRIAYQLLADLLAVIQRVATGREGELITSSSVSLSSSSEWVNVLSEVISMLGETINQHLTAEEEQRQKYALALVTAPDVSLALQAEDVPVFIPSLEEIDNHQQVLSYLIGRLDTVEEEVELFYGREAGVFKARSLLTAVFERNQTLLRGKESEGVKDDDTSIKKVLQAMNHLLEESLLTMQHLTTLHDNYHATTGNDLPSSLQGCFGESLSAFNQEGKEWTLRELHSWSLAVLGNCQRSYPIESTRRLLNFLQPLPRVDDSVLGLLAEMQGLGIRLRSVSAALVEEVVLGYKAQTKLLYLALRLFRHLLAKGYCHKQGEEEEGDGEEGEKDGDPMRSQTWQEEQDGTGMGEGEGRKDVSNQITNEEQLLDLKQDQEKPADEGEKPSTEKPKPQEDQKEEEGVEMQQDFQGDLFDLPEGGDEEEDDDEDDQDSVDRELDHDQQPMDMDNVVSEKQWDEDSDEEQEDQQQQEKFERDNAMDGPALEDEMHTKETGDDDDEMDEEGGDQKEQQPKPKNKDHQQEEEGQEEEHINEDHEEDYMQKPQGVEMQKKEDEQAQQQEENQEDQEGEGHDDAEGEKEEDDSAASPFPEQEEGASGEPQLEEEGQQQEMDEEQGGEDLPENMQIGTENEEGEEDEAMSEEGEDAAPQEEEGMEAAEEEAPKADESAKADIPNAPPPPARPVTFGVQAQDGQDNILPNSEEEEEGADNTDKDNKLGKAGEAQDERQRGSDEKGSRQSNSSRRDGAGGGDGRLEEDEQQVSEEQNQQEGNEMTPRQPPNPFLHRGDLQKEWFRRLKLSSTEGPEEESKQESDAPEEGDEGLDNDKTDDPSKRGEGLFEFDDGQRGDGEQVLGGTSEEAQPLPSEGHEKTEQSALDQQTPLPPPPAPPSNPSKERKRELTEKEEELEEGDASQKKRPRTAKDSLLEEDSEKKKKQEESSEKMDVDAQQEQPESMKEEQEEEKIGPLEEESDNHQQDQSKNLSNTPFTQREFTFGTDRNAVQELEDEDDGLDREIVVLHGQDNPVVVDRASQEEWQRCVVLMEGPALRLCEQLRLLLEPSLANRLQGDYRTGKRLNLRRVISYIASGYRKDKIWLRRTKLAKRAYQVMLLVDDSRSMCRAGPLAKQALALLSSALSRLEVGELSVASFASDVKVLHGFDEAWSGQAGGKIVQQLTFGAEATRLRDALQAVLPIFNKAKESSLASQQQSSQTTVLQLLFVVSDARIDSENRQLLHQTIRALAEQHILVVLLILDTPENSRDSIFQTRSVSFVDNKVVTTSYLDGFPFPYYLVVQDLERLPEVLADALKQWFELVKLQLSASS